MTAFDRIEQQLPELIDELASAHVPDYVDTLLQRTTRTRQRPAWSSLERWLPMGVIARTAFVPRLPWRTLALVALLVLAIAGALLFASGSSRRLPAPFGPAANGSIVYGTDAGDIRSVDPLTGTSTTIVGGPTKDIAPLLSRDGTKLVFVRNLEAKSALFVANVDGSGVRQLAEGFFGPSDLDPSPVDWSPSSTEVAAVADVFPGSLRNIQILATDGSASRTLDLGLNVTDVSWRPNGRELVFKGERNGTRGLYIVNADGSELRAIAPPNDLPFGWGSPTLSPDGTLITFHGTGATSEDGIHLLGIDSGVDRLLTFDGSADSGLGGPQFSPDGTHLVLERFANDRWQLVVVPAAGGGKPVPIGPFQPGGAAAPVLTFSPDGSQVLATYPTDGKTWLLATSGGSDREVSWAGTKYQSWQRLAQTP
jgi:Tol biopolymer transport system component